MEKELYHENLEKLYEHFGRDQPVISMRQAAAYLHKDPRTLRANKTFPIKKIGSRRLDVPLTALARWMSV